MDFFPEFLYLSIKSIIIERMLKFLFFKKQKQNS